MDNLGPLLKLDLDALDAIQVSVESEVIDTDLVNILYVGEISQDLFLQGEGIQELVRRVEDWKAWETTKCEQAVKIQVDAKKLPSDQSILSRAKRMGYRVKVLQALRNSSPWIVQTETGTAKEISVELAKGSKQTLNLAIAKALAGASYWAKNFPYGIILKAIGAGFQSASEMVQPSLHTLVGYEFDQASGTSQSVLATVWWKVTFAEDADNSSTNTGSATISLSVQYDRFDLALWKVASEKIDPKTTEVGREINKERSLTVINPLTAEDEDEDE